MRARARRRFPPTLIVGGLMLAAGASLALFLRGGPGGASPAAASPSPAAAPAAPEPVEAVPLDPPEPEPAPPPPAAAGPFDLERVRLQLDPAQAVEEDGRLVQRLSDGTTVVYALDPKAQQTILQLFEKYDVPIGAAVAVEVATGRVVVFAGRARGPVERHPCLDASGPAASIFKIVTTAALLEDGGSARDTKVCYPNGAGLRRLSLRDVETPAEEGADGVTCSTLEEGLAKSINPVFARLADAKLTPRVLLRHAERFVFGRALPFDLPVDVSPVEVPKERLEFARTASGFWHVGLSPLHGAALAQAVANQGRMMQPLLIDEVRAADGRVLWKAEPKLLRRVVRQDTARTLADMLVRTVTSGTGRREFVDSQGRPYLAVEAAGKTGSLNNPDPFMAYTWFVGFAPAGEGAEPRYAVAALVVNEERWRIKATLVARETLRTLLPK